MSSDKGVWKSSDKYGDSWSKIITSNDTSSAIPTQIVKNTNLANMNISHRGKMWYNYDRGVNDYDWTQVISANMRGSCIKYHNGTIFIAGSSGLYYSENGTAFIKVDGVGSLNGASMFDNTMGCGWSEWIVLQ